MNETVNQEPVTTAAGEQQEPRTFTQAEVNSIVADRLTRERAKYADYNNLKAKAQQFDTTKAELDALNAANAQRDMKARVSAATGVPAELLTGEPRKPAPRRRRLLQPMQSRCAAIPMSGTAATRIMSRPMMAALQQLSAVIGNTARNPLIPMDFDFIRG